MRDILTILAIFLVVVLTAALAVPYFVDWTAERSLMEAQLSNLLGQQVKIRGGIDLKLLPTPYLQLANVEVADPAAGSDIRAAEVHLEIALTALMRGEVDFVEARLVRPQLRLRIDNGSVPLPVPRALPQQMQFDRISVEDGSVTIDDPATGRTFAFDKIGLDAEVDALTGPYRGDGHFAMGGAPTAFRFSTGERQENHLHFKLIVDANRLHPRADLEASLIFDRHALPSVSGTLNLSGHTQNTVALPWQASGSLHADLREATISKLDLRLGDENHLATFDGMAKFDLGAQPRAVLKLKAQQIDLDKLLAVKTGPPPMQRLANLIDRLGKSDDLAAFGLPFSLEASADSALLGGVTLTGLSGALTMSAPQAAQLRFAADGPGRAHLSIDGNLDTGIAAAFKGRIEASADDVPRLKDWLAANLPQAIPAAVPPIRVFSMSGTATISDIGFVGSDLSLQVDGSRLSGTLAYTKALGPDPARLFADLSAPALELDSLPDLSGLARQSKGVDLDVALDADAVKVNGIEQGVIEAGHIALKFTRTGSDLRLENLSINGFDGAAVAASGYWNGQAGKLTAKLDADRLDALAQLVHRFSSGTAPDMLVAHAGDFAPAHLDLSAEARIDAGALRVSALSLAGTAGQTNISGKADQDPQVPGDFTLSLRLDAHDSTALLRQIGFSTLPLQDTGPGSIQMTARGGRRLDATITALLAGTNFAFRGSVDPDLAEPHASGTAKLTSPDLSGFLRATALALPDLTQRLPADLSASVDASGKGLAFDHVTGIFDGNKIAGRIVYDSRGITGALDTDKLALADLLGIALGPAQQPKGGALWSDQPFAAAEINPPPVDLAVHVANFALWPPVSGEDARFNLKVTGGATGVALGIHQLTAKIGAGRAMADLTMRRNGGNVAAQAHLRLSDTDVALPSVHGRLSADLDIAGTGDSAAALVSGFAGSGTLSFDNLALPKSDPGAMGRVFTAVEEDRLGIDEAEIDRVLLGEFAKQPLVLGKIDFDAGLAAGVLRLTQKTGTGTTIAPGITENLDAALDIRGLTLNEENVLSLRALPKNWSGPPPQVTLVWNGRLTNPAQTLDATTFVNALAARTIARESARIEAQEFDVHEHAFFVARLQSERHREEERLKAEEDAQRAAELEQERKEQAAAAEQKAEDDKRKTDEAARNPETPMQIGRPVPAVAAPAAGTTTIPDPTAAGRY